MHQSLKLLRIFYLLLVNIILKESIYQNVIDPFI